MAGSTMGQTVTAALLLLATTAPASLSGSPDDGWYVCTGVATRPGAPWNGTTTVPFLGSFRSFSGCQAACEAIPNCTAFTFGGSTPHVSPTGKDWHNRCYGRTDATWQLVRMEDEWSGCLPTRNSACPHKARPGSPSVGGNPAGNAVVVDAGACMHRNGTCRTARQVGAGVLLSLNATHPRTEVIEPLHLHAHRGDWGVLPAIHERLASLGITRSEPLLADLWCYQHGCEHGFSSLGEGEWPGDNGNWTGWEAFVTKTVGKAPEGVVFDIWNEPGQHGYFWNRNHSQYLEMWTHAVTVARQTQPGVQVSGPSWSGFDLAWIHQFLIDTSKLGVAPDIVSWHEFIPLGRDIPQNVDAIRGILQDLGLGERPISINEMVRGGDNFNPAVHISYFANLERADVDSACHSCWAEPVADNEKTPCNSLGGHDNPIWPGRGDNCGQWQTGNRQTLDGLVTCDGTDLPRGVWWGYKSYGSLQGTLLQVNASEEGDAVAVIADDGHSVSLSVGRLQGGSSPPHGQCTGSSGGGGGHPATDGVRVVVQRIPSSLVGPDGTVQVAQAIIRDTGVLPLERPAVVNTSVHLCKDGAVDFTIAMDVSDAALVVLGPKASATVAAFAVPPPRLKADDDALLLSSIPVDGVLSLDGPWSFTTDEADAGLIGHWFDPTVAARQLTHTIRVPGTSVGAAGFGNSTLLKHHEYLGVSWFAKTVAIPAEWRSSASGGDSTVDSGTATLSLRFGGVKDTIEVWEGGQPIGNHSGFMDGFEIDLTPALLRRATQLELNSTKSR